MWVLIGRGPGFALLNIRRCGSTCFPFLAIKSGLDILSCFSYVIGAGTD
jgi:hypothetical protein